MQTNFLAKQFEGCCDQDSRTSLKKGKQECKGEFPRTVRRDKNGKIIEALCRPRVVCHGVAKELDLKDSGRKNMLGALAGTRRTSWFSATSAMLAKVFRSNTNIQTNYRIPITTKTHDPHCTKKRCVRKLSSLKQTRKLLRIAQRAMKQMVGYFGGYISKRQKVGQYELKKSIGSLPLLKQKLEKRGVQAASAQLAHVCNKMFTTLESKGILRTAPEEFMLASQYRPDDELFAEFIRTFRHTFFFRSLLRRAFRRFSRG